MNSIEVARRAVEQLRQEGFTRMRVVDNLDNPSDRWIQVTEGPLKTNTLQPGETNERYTRITLEVDDFEEDASVVERIAAELRKRLDNLRNYTPSE